MVNPVRDPKNSNPNPNLFAQKTHHTNKQLQKCFWLLLVTQSGRSSPPFPAKYILIWRTDCAAKNEFYRVERGLTPHTLSLCCSPIVFLGLNLVVRILTCLTLKPAKQPATKVVGPPEKDRPGWGMGYGYKVWGTRYEARGEDKKRRQQFEF